MIRALLLTGVLIAMVPALTPPEVDPPASADCKPCQAAAPEQIVEYAFGPGCNADDTNVILYAQHAWWEATGHRLAWQVQARPTSRTLTFQCVASNKSFPWPVDRDPYIGLWESGSKTIWLSRPYLYGADGDALVVHEIGHYLGLQHSARRPEFTCMQEHLESTCIDQGVPFLDRARVCMAKRWSCRP